MGRLGERGRALLGVVACTLGAAVLLGRSGLDGRLTRDQAVYAYAGQQMVHGVAPYRSVFDPKGPVATFAAAAGAWLGQMTGHAELTGIRLVYGALTCLGVGALFLLAREVWGSTLAGFGAALGLCCLPSLATNTFSGPEAHAPLVLLISLTLWTALRGRWFLAGVCSGLSILTWQPLLVLPLVVVLAAVWTTEPGEHRRSVMRAAGGIGLVLLAMLGFFLVTRTVGVAFDATVRFPLTGIDQGATVASRVDAIRGAVATSGALRGTAMVVGALGFLVLSAVALVKGSDTWRERSRDRFGLVVVVPGLASAAYCLYDFQGPHDLIALLPYAALGLGGLVAHVARLLPSRTSGLVAGALLLVLAGLAWVAPLGEASGLAKQRVQATSIASLVPPGSTMWAFGDPRPLVLTGRRNPDRFIFLSSGVDAWKANHIPGGLTAWEADIRRTAPAVAVFGGYHEGSIYPALLAFFQNQRYRSRSLGPWQVFLAPGVHWRDRSRDARSTATSTPDVLAARSLVNESSSRSNRRYLAKVRRLLRR